MKLTNLPDNELLSNLHSLLASMRLQTAKLLLYLIEVEERRLHLASACPSMFIFCTRDLGMSEGEAFRRLAAARIAQRFPVVLDLIENGKVHLSALALLSKHSTDDNFAELLMAACGKTKREVEQLLAARFPSADVPSTIRKIPARPGHDIAASAGAALPPPASAGAALPPAPPLEPTTRMHRSDLAVVAPAPQPPTSVESPNLRSDCAMVSAAEEGAPPQDFALPRAATASLSAPHASLRPLSADRYKVQFTADQALKDKLERARDLLRHANPSGDLGIVMDRALDLLLAELEKKKLGKTDHPKPARPSKSGAVTQAVRREVVARDGERCSFVDAEGRRCPARGFLEIDHVEPRALGGSGTAGNCRVLCAAHNRFAAEQVFGRAYIDRQIHFRQSNRRDQPERASEEEPTIRGARSTRRAPPGHSGNRG
jgi:hypothetical protein